MKFPEVTVCPPRNTFTDLNYDLMIAEKIILNDNMRYEMLEYVLQLIEADEILNNNLTKMAEDNRYYNWYHGFTDIELPFFYTSSYDNVPSRLKYYLYTSATSGGVVFGSDRSPRCHYLVYLSVFYGSLLSLGLRVSPNSGRLVIN